MATSWKEDDRDTLALFLETILESYREGKISRVRIYAIGDPGIPKRCYWQLGNPRA